jgi:hypothetical protein
MAAEAEPIPIYQTAERTNKHACTSCLGQVDSDTYFALDHLCSPCSEMPVSAHGSVRRDSIPA